MMEFSFLRRIRTYSGQNSYKDALDEAEDYMCAWNDHKGSILRLVSVEKQTSSEG